MPVRRVEAGQLFVLPLRVVTGRVPLGVSRKWVPDTPEVSGPDGDEGPLNRENGRCRSRVRT